MRVGFLMFCAVVCNSLLLSEPEDSTEIYDYDYSAPSFQDFTNTQEPLLFEEGYTADDAGYVMSIIVPVRSTEFHVFEEKLAQDSTLYLTDFNNVMTQLPTPDANCVNVIIPNPNHQQLFNLYNILFVNSWNYDIYYYETIESMWLFYKPLMGDDFGF
jgi:hypothetical protein